MRFARQVQATFDGVPVTLVSAQATAETTVETLDGKEQDDRWHGTDEHGHEHAPATYVDQGGTRRVRSYPTLEEAYGPPEWCDDCQEDHRPFLGYRCRICGDTVTPGERPAQPIVIHGAEKYVVTLYRDELPAPVSFDDERRMTIGDRELSVRKMKESLPVGGAATVEFEGYERPRSLGGVT